MTSGVRRWRASVCLAVTAGALVTAGTTVQDGHPMPGAVASSPTPSSSPSSPGPGACPSSYVPPDPNRPVVRLTFALDDTLTHVTGTEHIQFTPDAPITELVFRLT